MSKLKEIVVITTGGTISMKESAPKKGALPLLSGEDLLKIIPPSLIPLQKITINDFSNLPSAHFSLIDLWNITERIRILKKEKKDVGFIVTMGTDILEEAAYFIDLIAGHIAPIVITGAMRTVGQLGYDGYANLYHSLIAVSAFENSKIGAVLVFNEQIHAVRDVQKMHSISLDTFVSPGWGPLGWIVEGEALIRRIPTCREMIAAKPPFPKVELIKCTAGMSTDLLDLVADKVDGLVVEAFGVGHVAPNVAGTLQAIAEKGIPVVLTSRCSAGNTLIRTYGFIGSESDLIKRKIIMCRGLTGPKARIKLILSLSAGEEIKKIEERFSLEYQRDKIPDMVVKA